MAAWAAQTAGGESCADAVEGTISSPSASHAAVDMLRMAMEDNPYRPDTVRLWALLIPAAAYLAWMTYWPTITGMTLVDGSVGVVLGLYICSHPAANGIDLFFVQRGTFRRMFSGWSGFRWLLLNALIMFVGWIIIVLGVSRFTAIREIRN